MGICVYRCVWMYVCACVCMCVGTNVFKDICIYVYICAQSKKNLDM